MNAIVPLCQSLQSSFIMVLMVLLATGGGCGEKPPEAAIDWNSPQMRAIENQWQSLQDAYDKDTKGQVEGGKERYGKLVGAVDQLLRKHLSGERLGQLVASSDMVPIRSDDRSPSVNDVLAFMVKSFVQTGDRDQLVVLLSKRCPDWVDWPENIEFYLTFRGAKLKDPILVLGEAYAKCHVPETRHTLAAAVRRGFAGLGIRGKVEADFVENAMQWYKKEKGHLVVNSSYPTNETVPGGITFIDSYEKNPELFDHPSPSREPLFKEMAVPPEGSKSGGENPAS